MSSGFKCRRPSRAQLEFERAVLMDSFIAACVVVVMALVMTVMS